MGWGKGARGGRDASARRCRPPGFGIIASMTFPGSESFLHRSAVWRSALQRAGRSLRRWPWLATLSTLRQRFREDRLGVTAGSLTFTTVIALVPLVTVTFAIFTAFPMFGSFRKALELYLVQNLVPDAIARPVLQQLTLFASKAHRVGAVGLVVLGFTAIALLLTIDRTLNAIWRVRKPRPIAQRVLVYWAAATLGPLVLGVSLSITSYALSVSKGLTAALPGGVAWLLDVFEFALLAGGMAALFRYVPNTQVRWVHAWAGGVFVALGFDLAKRVLAWYLGMAPLYTTIYGAFAALPILLVWIYASWVIVLLGAVMAAYAPSLDMRVQRQDPLPGWRLTLALRLLQALQQARGGVQRGVSLAGLAEALRVDPLQIDPVMELLAQLDWVGRLEEAGEPRLVLLVDPTATPLEPLLDRLLLAPHSANRELRQRLGWKAVSLADALVLSSHA